MSRNKARGTSFERLIADGLAAALNDDRIDRAPMRGNAEDAEAASRRRAGALKASRAAAQKAMSIPFEDRIAAKTVRRESGCWEWTGTRYSNGYASLCWQGKSGLAHRMTYEHYVGPIPTGLVIDHLCRNKGCVNPAHLEPVTTGENTRRAMRTHCVNGHPFDEENTWMYKGKRYCRECRRRRVREFQAKARA